MILYRVIFFEDLTIKENVLLSALYNLRNTKKICVASFSSAFNLSQDTIYNVFKELEYKGYIYIEKSYNWQKQKRQNHYILQAKTLEAYTPKPTKKGSAKVYKREIATPAWYDEYKEELKQQSEESDKRADKITKEQNNEYLKNLAAEVFSND